MSRPADSEVTASGVYFALQLGPTMPLDPRNDGAMLGSSRASDEPASHGSAPGHGGAPGHSSGAEPSLTDVYRELAPAIHRMMLRLGIPERYAEDATNDVFVTALPRWNEFRGDSSRRTWLFGFAVKIAANQRRKLGRAGEETALGGQDLDTSPSLVADPFEQASAHQAIEQLSTLLDTLSLEERALWLLVYYEDVSVTDAAQVLGLSAPKAYVMAKWVHAKLVKAWKRNNPPEAWRTW